MGRGGVRLGCRGSSHLGGVCLGLPRQQPPRGVCLAAEQQRRECSFGLPRQQPPRGRLFGCYRGRQPHRGVLVWVLPRGCLFGAAEAGSSLGGCLFGAAEAGSSFGGCLFDAAEPPLGSVWLRRYRLGESLLYGLGNIWLRYTDAYSLAILNSWGSMWMTLSLDLPTRNCVKLLRSMKDKFQMSSIGELTLFLGLQVKQEDNRIFISQDKYLAKILRNFSFTYVKSASTLIETEKPLLKDPDASNEELKEPMEDQPLPVDASPTALSPGYIVDSDPKKDEKDPKEDPAYYHADRKNNKDDESSNDGDDDDYVEKDEEDKEDEEHPAPADPSDVSTDDLVPSS
nr:putative ribonuclease H-like domain-containing protein [Tanacetum cinerariifolium]